MHPWQSPSSYNCCVVTLMALELHLRGIDQQDRNRFLSLPVYGACTVCVSVGQH
ncbi:hypothetical protein PR003_g10370 [Phytophthora rubi]|uniref:Uncharacterized protein n=1 Tax=Phytophthora rubi TaxID=129364 RepID=A0A6A4F5T8_9STRA|nr:hypothetical protein PR003_g10370 [Phytophthora rubi]